ncbi:MAG: hypothetical protein LBC13_00305, partial [Clostridiales bacterium]|nr:hypothetical protein [Clostridiales bacterium]
MSYKFLTPLQVWESFNPVKEPVELSIMKTSEHEGIHSSECFFTSETVSDGKVRGFFKIYAKTEWEDAAERRPTVVLLPAIAPLNLKSYLHWFLDRGIAVAVLNYAGAASDSDKGCTCYPPSLEYGNFLKAGSHLHRVAESARDTTWFLWTKLVRRALTALSETAFVDKERLALVGIREGAQIAWQVAGIDDRLKAVMPLFGCGYAEYSGHFKYGSSNNIEMTEEHKCWIAGVAPQSFAQFIGCPLYFLSGSNSVYGDMDRAYDIVNFVQSPHALMGISPMRDSQLGADIIESALKWLDYALNGLLEERVLPELKFENRSGRLFLNIRVNDNIEILRVYMSENEVDPTLRTWERIADVQTADITDKEIVCAIPVYKNHGRVFVYANALYNDGIIASSRMVTEVPEQLGIIAEAAPSLAERVIYAGSAGVNGAFVSERERLSLDGGFVIAAEGPEGITGITADNACLSTYKLNKSVFSKDKTRLLNFSAFSREKRNITLSLKTADDDAGVYENDVELSGL